MIQFQLNKASYTPLYKQLALEFVRQIREGIMLPGTQMPSEREISDIFKVSRTTARQAIDELVTQSFVYREQGKGTFVADPGMRDLMGFTSFSGHMRTLGHVPSSKILQKKIIKPDEKLRAILRLEVGENVLLLERVRMADDKPMALQYSHIPEKLVPGLVDEDLTDKSLFDILKNRYFIFPTWSEAKVEANVLWEHDAEELDLEVNSPCLIVRGLTYTDTFDVVESVKTIYRGGLTLHIGRQKMLI
jgi:GntR family transcriptional regulator